MNRLLSLLFTTTLLTNLVSCSKSNGDEVTETLPTATITIASPTPDAVFNKGDVITIKAQAISTESMHGYDLAIRKAGETSSNIYFIHIHDHNDTLNIEQPWKSDVTAPANLEAEISVYVDHDGHTQKGKVSFRIQ